MKLFARNMIIKCFFAAFSLSLHATGVPLIDGYYSPYPPTQSVNPEVDALVARGEYLSRAGDCIACHTNVAQHTQAYAGGLPIETPFGTFYSPNITPDKETGIGLWSEADFIRAVKEGRSPAGENYFPVFPYVYFANLSDDDARALYAYFMHIPAVKQQNRSLPFPFNVPGARLSLWGWKLLFFYPNQKFTPDSTKSAEWNRGHYLVDGLAHCSMCHSPLNPLGSVKQNNYLTGAFIDGYWAPNITKQGLADVTAEEVADVFVTHQLLNNAGPVAGPMAEVNHDSLQYLTLEDRVAIATYIKTVESDDPLKLPPVASKVPLARGAEVYRSACIICHQNGEMTAPRIGDSANWYQRLQDNGITTLYKHVINGYNSMPIKGACVNCSNKDIEYAVDYLLNQSLTRSQLLNFASIKHAETPVGKTVYDDKCAACHTEGRAGAPKLGDKSVWEKLAAQNMDVLVLNTLNGDKHPKNGGCSKCTTAEVMSAIKYMLDTAQINGNYSLW